MLALKSSSELATKAIVTCLALHGTLLPSKPAEAQAFPSKPIQIVVPFEPGGAVDVGARLLGDRLGNHIGQRGYVVNKPGAATVIATEFVARSVPDGYTLLVNSSSMIKTELARKATGQGMPYDIQKDLNPVAIYYRQPALLVLSPKLAFRNLEELIAFAKTNPGRIRYGSFGFGSVPHFTTEYLSTVTGATFTHVPYKGGSPTVPALLRGEIDMIFLGLVSAAPNVKSGKLKAIAITSSERSSAFPDIQPLAHAISGINVELETWHALFSPSNTPRAVLDRLTVGVAAVAKEKEFVERLEATGATVGLLPADKVRTIIDEDVKTWSPIVAKMKLED